MAWTAVAHSKTLRWALLLGGEAALVAVIAVTFWLQDWQYSLPTPRPASLHQAAVGSALRLTEIDSLLGKDAPPDRPILLHFFNPACPCSRFNASHLRALLTQFQNEVTIVAVLEAADPQQARAEFATWQLNCATIIDADGSVANQVGVYSTPQAVVLNSKGRLYYRGNYNLTRYCVSPETEFVRLALEACVNGEPLPEFPAAATIAQGCPLPIDQRLHNQERPR